MLTKNPKWLLVGLCGRQEGGKIVAFVAQKCRVLGSLPDRLYQKNFCEKLTFWILDKNAQNWKKTCKVCILVLKILEMSKKCLRFENVQNAWKAYFSACNGRKPILSPSHSKICVFGKKSQLSPTFGRSTFVAKIRIFWFTLLENSVFHVAFGSVNNNFEWFLVTLGGWQEGGKIIPFVAQKCRVIGSLLDRLYQKNFCEKLTFWILDKNAQNWKKNV